MIPNYTDHHGYLWCFKDDMGKRKVERKRRLSHKKVRSKYPVEFTARNGCIKGSSSSINHACMVLGVDPRGVYRSIVDKTPHEFIWNCPFDDNAYES